MYQNEPARNMSCITRRNHVARDATKWSISWRRQTHQKTNQVSISVGSVRGFFTSDLEKLNISRRIDNAVLDDSNNHRGAGTQSRKPGTPESRSRIHGLSGASQRTKPNAHVPESQWHP